MICNCKHRGAIVLTVFFVLFFSLQGFSQIRWDGGGNDGQWTTVTNWAGDILPSSTDDVILDNSFVAGNYMVLLPGNTEIITVKTLVIQPATGNSIELVLPASNLASPGLIVTGPGYGLTIHAGGIFRNASGISSGQSLQVADSLRINNGGQYIHQTRASHAASVAQVLSRGAGTETGSVEFDVPGTTGYTISASGRVYGTLILSANAAGVNRTYSSGGAGSLVIRGDFRLNTLVNYNINLGGNVIVNGDFVHAGQSLNISSGGDNTVLMLKRNYFQSGIITETSTGLPVIELCGEAPQQVQITGSIINSIGYRMNNAAGAVMQTPVSLPWKLELQDGKIITTPVNLLTLSASCTVQADSLSHHSFINGPLRKEGLSATDHFLFPVGKDNNMRWLALKNATGNYTVEYFKSDPRQMSSTLGAGVDHISQLEYWRVAADEVVAAAANPELSFMDPNSGGVTDLSTLRVAQLINNIWSDAGNTAVSGTPGSNGSVTGNAATTFSYFTLAGSTASANPLPVGIFSFTAHTRNNLNLLRWIYDGDEASWFDILHSTNNRAFTTVGRIYAASGRKQYQLTHRSTGINYYKIYTMKKNGLFQQGPVVAVTNSGFNDWLLSVNGRNHITVTISSTRQKTEICTIISATGMVAKNFTAWLSPGINNIIVDVSSLPRGMYTIRSSTNSVLFSKL